MKLLTIAAAFLLMAADAAPSAETGTASGHYAEEDVPRIDFKHAVAVRFDDAEGLALDGAGVRLLLSDRPVHADALLKIAFPEVTEMARRGEVRGLLVHFDPGKRTEIRVTILDRPANPNEMLTSINISDSEGLWARLTSDGQRIAGEFKPRESTGFAFDAPLFHDPVVADLRGAETQKSELTALLVGHYDAIGNGKGTPLPAGYEAEARQALKEAVANARKASRLVIRSRTAVLLMPDKSFASFVRENGVWKVAD